ncbi:unnamed protein product [Symbiodinium natans]|uniref:Uncharacterized protein n=1 Tax=Symbiodinium natans TaxID=878477 RepID=A0A812V9J8_9DINO|nr:unnamed protein product [Symbiodinium natans]
MVQWHMDLSREPIRRQAEAGGGDEELIGLLWHACTCQGACYGTMVAHIVLVPGGPKPLLAADPAQFAVPMQFFRLVLLLAAATASKHRNRHDKCEEGSPSCVRSSGPTFLQYKRRVHTLAKSSRCQGDDLTLCKPEVESCAPFAEWPDVDGGVTCGGCRALVKAEPYEGRCDRYCSSFGHRCIAAAEERAETCEVEEEKRCDEAPGRALGGRRPLHHGTVEPSRYSEPAAKPAEHDAKSTEHDAEPAEHDTEPAEHDTQPAEHDAEPAEHDAEPAEHDAEPAEHDAEPAEHDAKPTAHGALRALRGMARCGRCYLRRLSSTRAPRLQLLRVQV